MNKKLTKDTGITLIALVITIIVLLILAGVTIASLTGENGMLQRASDAKTETEEARIREKLQIAWNGVQIEGIPKGWDNETKAQEFENELKKDDNTATAVLNASTIKVTYEGYEATINVNEGSIIEIAKIEEDNSSIWVYNHEDQTVKRGKKVLNVGDFIQYNSPVKISDDTKWCVLGADENGHLLLIANRNAAIKELKGTDIYSFDTSNNKYTDNSVQTLDNLCQQYIDNDSALYARSVNLNDIDTITGFNPKCIQNGDNGSWGKTGEPIRKGYVDEYDNEVKYTLTREYKYGDWYFKKMEWDGNISGYNSTTRNTDFKIPGQNSMPKVETIEYTVKNNYYIEYLTSSKPNSGIELSEKVLGCFKQSWNSADGGMFWLATPYVHTMDGWFYVGLNRFSYSGCYTTYRRFMEYINWLYI